MPREVVYLPLFEFIIEIESQMAVVMRQLGRIEEADEVERRLASVKEALN